MIIGTRVDSWACWDLGLPTLHGQKGGMTVMIFVWRYIIELGRPRISGWQCLTSTLI